ncbi:c-type cytochrome biogenesis protein CcmI [Glaciecola sp. XM2]|uniref:c-type cytochrome biogenesis protein CcmI n=1 Tax=Glaciecola sp. XM2 TaxID=1914931 RepID=UPI001BDF35E5|nr:c-type cytochrome biogenesis protein CcmI [Glaciecola sp. XM2]
MTDFYLYAIALVVVSVFFVLVPLLRKAKQAKLQITNANVVKQRITELEREVEEGLISEKDKLTAVKELKLALVEESERLEKGQVAPVKTVNWLVVGLLSLPAIAVGVWVYFTSNQLTGLQEYVMAQSQAADLTQRIQGQTGGEVTPNDYAKFALVIRKRLRETPEDVEGWRLLGQVQMSIGRMDESIAAFEKALRLAPDDLEIRERYAQALMAAGTEESLGNAKRQVDYLVSIAPDNRDYRLLLTVVATQLGDTDVAVENFLMIRGQLSPSSNFYQSLVAQLINIGAPESLLRPDAASQPVVEVPAPEVQGTSIGVDIMLDPSLEANLPEDGYLIVFAQNAQSESRVPLAVARYRLGEFPFSMVLSQSDAMMPSMTLATASSVRLTARISMDADVMPSPGELQGEINELELIQGEQVSAVILINKEI